jgi:hypothetical protein
MQSKSTAPRTPRLASPYVPLAAVALMLSAAAALTITGGPVYAWTACRDAVLAGLHAVAMWVS